MKTKKEISEKSFFNDKKFVPDTSVLISGVFRELIEKEEISGEILIPEFVVEELRAQASRGQEIGFKGLDELKKIRGLSDSGKIILNKIGRRQTYEEIKLAKYGRIDALILDVAREEKATIITSDIVQALVAEVEGISVKYFKPYETSKSITIEDMITDDTMSLHLKEGTKPYAKRGRPGNVDVVILDEKRLTNDDMEGIIKEIFDKARYEKDAFIESGEYGANVIQLKNLRIAIAKPPFSDGL